jgi:hypothetical protein
MSLSLSPEKGLPDIHLYPSAGAGANRQLCVLGPILQNLEELHLSENPHILRDRPDRALGGFGNLRVLDLSECGITSFEEVEAAFGHLARYEPSFFRCSPISLLEVNAFRDLD